MATTFSSAPKVAAIAAELIAEHHQALVEAPIVYVFRSPAATVRGRTVLGAARRVSGLNAFLVALAAGEEIDEDDDLSFFVIEIARQEWLAASDAERAALVDHELCHLAVDEETGALTLRGHDLEEFNSVVARHGLWRDDVRAFADICGGR